ncbi:MAG: S-layer homology domain-containing protein, partial [Alkaliphilus sp.]|nr:S-layer homology domain-containing protein [Alkaliphilus sp.]
MKNKRLLSLILVLIFITGSSITALGANVFSDVSNTHWARAFISGMSEKGIISGYFDDKTLKFNFRPENPVTYVESVQMIYNTLKATDQLKSTTGLVEKYRAILTNANIPAWAHEAVAYALEYKIIQVGDLQSFVRNGVQQNAKREDVAIFLGKAIDINDEVRADSIVRPVLGFVDGEMVKDQAVPYVAWLVRENIFTGDTQNRFNPTQSIKRAEMATICFKSYDMLEDLAVEPPVTPPVIVNPETKIVSFVVQNERMIIVKDDENAEYVYTLEPAGVVKRNGVVARFNDIKVGDSVALTFDAAKKLIGIEISNVVSQFEGVIYDVEEEDDHYLLTVSDAFDINFKREFMVYDDSRVIVDNKSVSISVLKEGDRVIVDFVGQKAAKIEVLLTEGTYSGILETRVTFADNPTVKIKTTNNQVLEFVISDRVDVTRDGRTADLVELQVGDVVKVVVRQNRITDIDATGRSVERTVEGTIRGIRMENPDKLVVLLDGESKEVTYDISSRVNITLDRKSAELFDLRLNYDVEITLENNVVTEVEAKSVQLNTSYSGEVVRVHERLGILTINYIDPVTKNTETLTVNVVDSTSIIQRTGTV